MENFNERLKQAMKLKNVTQTELCERTGIPKSAMSQYVSGAFTPKQERTYLIAKALNVNESWLLGFDNVTMDREKNAPDEAGSEPIAIKATRKEWIEIMSRMSDENRQKLQDYAELLLLKQDRGGQED